MPDTGGEISEGALALGVADPDGMSIGTKEEEEEEEKLVPFVDVLFGGRLASMVVCEGCRHVSGLSLRAALGTEARSDLGCAFSLDRFPTHTKIFTIFPCRCGPRPSRNNERCVCVQCR